MPKYYGCPCEGCGKPLTLQDDIVVCPDCGAPCRGGFGSPRKVNGFAKGSPTRGAVERQRD